jgi:serine/threonine-protein kinase RsbW
MPGDDSGAEELDPAPFRLVIAANPLSVRAALRALMSAGVMKGVSGEGRGVAEIVLAEILNNVVEHAYADRAGEIELGVLRAGGSLFCKVVDTGRPMPGGKPPDPVLSPAEELPEGGFGWFLIRSLAQDLDYRRLNGRNEICLRLPALA